MGAPLAGRPPVICLFGGDTQMKLLVLILNRIEHVTPVLKAWLAEGISGATILDSTGMGRTLSETVPIFGALKHLTNGDGPYNKTIISVMPDSLVPAAKAVVQKICGDLGQPGTGLMFTVPIDEVIGLAPSGDVDLA